MRRLASVVLFSLLVVATTSSSAGALAGQLAVGSGVDNQGGAFAFLVKGTGTGADATGTFQYDNSSSGVTFVGDVSCMIVATSTRCAWPTSGASSPRPTSRRS